MLFDLRPITVIKGIGKTKAGQLKRLGIQTVQDMLEHYPMRYEDRGPVTPIALLKDNDYGTIGARVVNISERKTRSFQTLTTVEVQDESGRAELIWFNQPHIKNRFWRGMDIVASGMSSKRNGTFQLSKVEWKEAKLSQCIRSVLPVYNSTDKLHQFIFRLAIESILPQLNLLETIPQEILNSYNLLPRNKCLQFIHYPPSHHDLSEAKRRLVFEELYFMQCALLYGKRQQKLSLAGIRHAPNGLLINKALASLPFMLTEDQKIAFSMICSDMEDTTPMRRLLQGDVGSGKTVLAILSLVKTVENGFQGAMMAPTEILAEQHYRTLQELLAPLEVHVALLTGSLTNKERAAMLLKLRTGSIDIVIGTHSLIQKDVHFSNLGLVITDEQHRFGIEQRAELEGKGHSPDVLVMTATPIPRTMALTIYGDLDVSTIKQLPPGRKPIKTYAVTSEVRNRVYSNLALKQIQQGHQVYVVCPLIDESAESDMRSVVTLFEELQATYMSGIECALFHGRMNQSQREQTITDFYKGKIKVLVATTVIEVGVNVPNATVMIIEDAHRFGLSQLHQLRGRIGRGKDESYCILVSDSKNEDSLYRLRSMTETQDGFLLAERDLILRGPGQFFGLRQHGMPELKLADIVHDFPILLQAREAAQKTIATPAYMNQIKPVLDYYYTTWIKGIPS